MRLSALRRLDHKTQPTQWLQRHRHACARCWAILSTGPASQARYERFARHHARLLTLRPPHSRLLKIWRSWKALWQNPFNMDKLMR